jgi:hypothetical protein
LNDSRALLDLTATALDARIGTASSAYTTDPDADFLRVAAGYTTSGELRKATPAKPHHPRKQRRPRRHRHADR